MGKWNGGVRVGWWRRGISLASGGIGLGWVDKRIGVDTVDVKVFEAEIKNEILVTRGQSHIATRDIFLNIIVNFCLVSFNMVVDCFNSLHK